MGLATSGKYLITSVSCGGYIIIGICPCVRLFVCNKCNNVTQKYFVGFSSNFHQYNVHICLSKSWFNFGDIFWRYLVTLWPGGGLHSTSKILLLNTVSLLILAAILIRQILPSGHIDCYLDWLSLVMFSLNCIRSICISGYIIWQVLGPSQISQLKSPPNINPFTI